ncbi:Cation-independent mannose-6-phosphate receptor CI-MPR [Xylographa opegraphella]|nr:Cation-independent mannose-6-phosphate receptor CI-MPR [Xylographa opegraphella]
MRILNPTLILALCLSSAQAADPKPLKPCTITSKSGLTFDLNAIAVQPLHDGKKAHKSDREESWRAAGYDYGSNFTLNFCAPVIEELEKVVGVDESLWRNVSAFYTKGGKTFSIGQTSTAPVLRGRKLVLNYTGGSPCDSSAAKRSIDLLDAAKNREDDDDDNDSEDDNPRPPKRPSKPRRKSSIISLLCDRELTVPATVAFVGASEDECTYFFESRSAAACGGVSAAQQAVGPAGVFGIIALIAAAVYLVGGVAYQRTVLHQRGWKQLPNYSMWAGMVGFVKDMLIILTSSCARLLPSRKGYNQLPTHSAARGGRGPSRAEDENRLIDQLDEEWDD